MQGAGEAGEEEREAIEVGKFGEGTSGDGEKAGIFFIAGAAEVLACGVFFVVRLEDGHEAVDEVFHKGADVVEIDGGCEDGDIGCEKTLDEGGHVVADFALAGSLIEAVAAIGAHFDIFLGKVNGFCFCACG